MADDTISQIRQKNSILRERLSRLIKEEERVGSHEDKENRFLTNLKKNVEEITSKKYELPSPKTKEVTYEPETKNYKKDHEISRNDKDHNLTKREYYSNNYDLPKDTEKEHDLSKEYQIPSTGHVHAYINDSFTEYEDPLAEQIHDDMVSRLQSQLQLQAAERKELIEEFQRKEANMFKEYRQKEVQLKKEVQLIEQQRDQDLQKLESKYLHHITELEHARNEAMTNETNLKAAIKKISVKLVVYKRQIGELITKNEALKSVNLYLTRDVLEPAEEPQYQGGDDTQSLMQMENTTELLIRGESEHLGKFTLVPKFRKYALMVLFAVRARRLVAARRAIDLRLQQLMNN